MYPFYLLRLWWKIIFFFTFQLKNILSADVVLGGNVLFISKIVLLFSQWQLAHIIFILHPAWKFEIRGSSDNSLAWNTYHFRRTKSRVSLEREACSCAELQVSPGFRGWKKHWLASCHRIFPTGQGDEWNSRHSDGRMRRTCTTVCHHRNLGGHFLTWWFFKLCLPRHGWPKIVTTSGVIEEIDELTLEDRRIWVKLIAEQLGLSREGVGSIIHEDLDMRKFSANWVPKCLNVDQIGQRCLWSELYLEFFQGDLKYFLSRLVTINEPWLYHNEPGTMQQSIEWRRRVSPRPKLFRGQNPREKLSPQFFGIKTASSHWLSSKEPN